MADRISTRGNLDGHSDDFAAFVQDDWKVNRDITVFLGLRYEIVGSWQEKDNILASFQPFEGGYHLVPNAQVAALLPPGLVALNRFRTADQVGVSSSLINTDKNNFSPRLGFAWRIGGSDKTVLRGGFGLFHPTAAVQGLRDNLASNMFRYSNTRNASPLAHGYTGAPSSSIRALSATRESIPTSRVPTSTSTTSPWSGRCRGASACA